MWPIPAPNIACPFCGAGFFAKTEYAKKKMASYHLKTSHPELSGLDPETVKEIVARGGSVG